MQRLTFYAGVPSTQNPKVAQLTTGYARVRTAATAGAGGDVTGTTDCADNHKHRIEGHGCSARMITRTYTDLTELLCFLDSRIANSAKSRDVPLPLDLLSSGQWKQVLEIAREAILAEIRYLQNHTTHPV